jgi:SOS-response transcriptional repressor LexA
MGWSQVDLADKSGVSQATISKIERGDQEQSVHTPILAATLGVDTLWLATGNGEMAFGGISQDLPNYNSNTESVSWPLGKVPLISNIQAGHWCEAIDNFQPGDAEEWLPAPAKHGPHAYALRVTGTSMEPRLREGEIVVVDPDRDPESGSIVVARMAENKEVTLKQLIREGGETYLKALNPHWPEPIIRMSEEWSVCGRVICKIEIF